MRINGSDQLDKIRLAITTKGYDGLDDAISNIFGKTRAFTLANVENGKVQNVKIIDNPAADYDHGSGPIAAKTLAELKVDLVITSQLGLGALELLQHHKITTMLVNPNIKVSEAVKKALSQLHKQSEKENNQ